MVAPTLLIPRSENPDLGTQISREAFWVVKVAAAHELYHKAVRKPVV